MVCHLERHGSGCRQDEIGRANRGGPFIGPACVHDRQVRTLAPDHVRDLRLDRFARRNHYEVDLLEAFAQGPGDLQLPRQHLVDDVAPGPGQDRNDRFTPFPDRRGLLRVIRNGQKSVKGRMADISGPNTVAAKIGFLEGPDARDAVDPSPNSAIAPRCPGPSLRGDVIQDRHLPTSADLRDGQVQCRRVDQNSRVDSLDRQKSLQASQHLDRLGHPFPGRRRHRRPNGHIVDALAPFSLHVGPGQTHETHVGYRRTGRTNQFGGMFVTALFGGTNQYSRRAFGVGHTSHTRFVGAIITVTAW